MEECKEHTQHGAEGLGCIAGFFSGVSPFAHLSNLKPTDPAAPRTRGLWPPVRRRRCRAAGPARAPRTPPSWSCCPRPTWTWGEQRGCVSCSPLPPPHHPLVPSACHFGVTSASPEGLQAPRGWGPQARICPPITKEARAPRPGAAVVVAQAGVIFRYSRLVFPRGWLLCLWGVAHLIST